MSYNRIDKSDIYLRRAMWESYNKKCVYCGIALEVRHMHVDHIFPVDEKNIIENNSLDLLAYISELKKNKFEKDSIENYALACSDCNIKKKNYFFGASSFRFFHEYAQRHVPDILKRINRCKGGINDFTNTYQSPLKFQKYSESELKCEAQVLSSIFQTSFRYGLGEVRIDAFLPMYYNDEIGCCISFKEIYQSDIFITYDEEDIKSYLFTGYKTSLDSNKRRWCNYYNDLINEPTYEINLPNIKLHTSLETLEQMAIICDRLFEEYTLQETTINNILGASDFLKTENKSYKLFSIRDDLFQILYEFMKKHQYDHPNGDANNIFHLTNSYKMFYLHQNLNSNENAGIYACIDIEEHSGYYDIIWSPGYTGREINRLLDFNNIIKWTAIYTYEWFINICIPAALNEHHLSSRTLRQLLFGKQKNNIYTESYLVEKSLIKSYKIER